MSSYNEVSVSISSQVFVTTTVYSTSPPVSGSVVVLAVFSTVIVGGTSVNVIVAVSVSIVGVPSLSFAVAVTSFVCVVVDSCGAVVSENVSVCVPRTGIV